MNAYRVRRMTRDEVSLAVSWATVEGWKPGLHDANSFWTVDPDGFFAGERAGRIVACGSALRYDDAFAFCGFYIVAPECRGQGLGMELTRARLDHVGPRNAGIDGVLAMVDRYARLGYRPVHKTTRHEWIPRTPVDEPNWIVPAGEIPIASLADYDARHFIARRERFLQSWLAQPNTRSLAAVENSRITGFGVLRPCADGYRIGPLFADSPAVAETLLTTLANSAIGSPIWIDIPDTNSAAVALAQRLAMTPVFACIRMYLRGDPHLPVEHIYGMTSYEAG